MNKSGDLKSPLGQLTSIPKKASEQLAKEPIEAIEEVEIQTGAKPPPTSTTSPQDDKSGSTPAPNKTDTLEVVKKMYEESEHKVGTPSDETISEVIEENPKKSPEEIQKTEDLVNAAINRDYLVSWKIMKVDEANDLGALGLFGEKYGETVKIYTIGDSEKLAMADPLSPTFSREFCGGPHVEHTGVIGHFKIVKEEACSAGIRRIKAIVTN